MYVVFRGRHGGWKNEGGGKRYDTPPRKGFWTPPGTVRFPPPSGVSVLFFLCKNPRQSRPEALLEGSKTLRESAFSGAFSSPHTFCTPHITDQGISLKFPNAVALNAAERRNPQKSLKRRQNSANASTQRTAKGCKRAHLVAPSTG